MIISRACSLAGRIGVPRRHARHMPQKWPCASWLALVALFAALAGCGGGAGESAPPQGAVRVQRVQVFGDSLADVGTFGLKATVQAPGATLFSERLPVALGLDAGCPYFEARSSNTFVPVGIGRCFNHAVAGGVIHDAGLSAVGDPRSLEIQFAAATALSDFSAGDLLLVDGGGNDAAALALAWLRRGDDAFATYAALLRTLLSASEVSAALTGGIPALEAAGGSYMRAVADRMHDLLRARALGRGAQRVLLLNAPDIAHTPRVQALLDRYATSEGGGAQGAASRLHAQALLRSWVDTFNHRLASRAAGEPRIAIVDFRAALDAWVSQPSTFGLRNVSTPACPNSVEGLPDASPAQVFAACTETALARSPPPGNTDGPDWHRRWLFADGFHPTPYGHELLHQAVMASMRRAGWY